MVPRATQIAVWMQHNIADDPDEPLFLYALKQTSRGDRQLVWEGGGTNRGIVAVVDFADSQLFVDGRYRSWGNVTMLADPVTREMMNVDPVLRERFGDGKLNWLTGAAKHLDPDEAEAIDRLAGGLPPQRLPSRSPRAGEEVWSWFGGLNLDLEKTFELAVYGSKRLWKRIGFPTAPLLQQRLPATKTSDRIMIPDLLAPGVVGEVKRSIGPNNGPAQIEGYLERLEQTRTDQGPWSGRLIHAEKHVSPALRHRLERSGAPIEVWSVERQGRRWKARQQYPD